MTSAHLAAEASDELGQHRLGELKLAMEHLGVTDFVRLGGDGHYRDSGMAWSESRQAIPRDVLRAGIFWTADLLEAANELVPLIRSRRPQVLITYDEFGGYGHPDHIQAHRVAMYGYLLAGVAELPARSGRALDASHGCCGTPAVRPGCETGIRALRDAGRHQDLRRLRSRRRDAADGVRGFGHRRRDRRHRLGAAEAGAMRAHATQITPDGFFFAAEPILGDRMWSHEYYRLAAGEPFPAADGWADDLFAGLSGP